MLKICGKRKIMNKFKLELPYIISKFEKHNEIKDRLLALIDILQAKESSQAGYKIKTDWHLPAEVKREYHEFIYPMISEHMIKVFDELAHQNFKLTNYWFQQYEKDGVHNWHQHRGASWSNIYYVELGKDCPKTILKNPSNLEQLIIPNVTEGDILTIPGLVWHSSQSNKSSDRKTVYVFNTW